MIREFNNNDLNSINEIGKQIKEDFVNKFNLININSDVEKVYVYEQENTVIGFIHISVSFEVIDIVNIAVDINNKNQGIASELINYIITELKPERMMLEVRSSNVPAINLYGKCGFKVINTRKNYYGNEDALVMELIV